jgi:hypothetical protein
MAELADAADSKSAGTWYLGGSIPPPGTRNPAIPRQKRLGISGAWACSAMTELQIQDGDCLVREATVHDFTAISQVVRRAGLRASNYTNWVRLWNENPFRGQLSVPLGWVLENKAQGIVGTLSNIVRMYSYHGEPVRVATASTWAVDTPYRTAAIFLAKQFFSQENIDVFLNTTASAAAAEVFKAFRCSEIPDPSYGQVLFWVTNYAGFAKSALRKLRVPVLPGMRQAAGMALHCRDLIGQRRPQFRRMDTQLLDGFDERFDVIWDLLCARQDRFLAVRTAESLTWQFGPALEDRNAVIVAALEGKAVAGYLIMIRGDDEQLDLRRLRVVDLQTARGEPDTVFSLMASALEHAAHSGVHIVEAVGFHKSKRDVLEQMSPRCRTYPSCPYLYKVKTDHHSLRDALQNADVWDASQFDGDASL